MGLGEECRELGMQGPAVPAGRSACLLLPYSTPKSALPHVCHATDSTVRRSQQHGPPEPATAGPVTGGARSWGKASETWKCQFKLKPISGKIKALCNVASSGFMG